MDKREFLELARATTDDLGAALTRALLFIEWLGRRIRYDVEFGFNFLKYLVRCSYLLPYRFYVRRRQRYLIARLASHGVSFDERASNVLLCGGPHRRLIEHDAGGPSAAAKCYVAFVLLQGIELQELFDSLYALSNRVERRISLFAGFVYIRRKSPQLYGSVFNSLSAWKNPEREKTRRAINRDCVKARDQTAGTLHQSFPRFV